MDLTVVVLNWNACRLLEPCVRSLEKQEGLAFETLVVDNVSEDDSVAMMRREFPHITLLQTVQNIGFGAGNNFALPHARGRYILFLNPDTIVMEGALATLVRYADAHPDIGILGPKLLNEDGSLQFSCRRYPNLGTGFFRNTPLGRLFPHNRFTTDYLMQDWDHAAPRDVEWVSGAALMIRAALLKQIGGFDEDFFMYCEDVDLCWRANHAPRCECEPQETGAGQEDRQNTGNQGNQNKVAVSGHRVGQETGETWRVTYCPDAVIYHLIGKSSDQVPTRMTYEFHRSQYLFYKKHYAASTPILVRPLIPVGIGMRAAGRMARYRAVQWQGRLRRMLQQPKIRKNRP